MTLTGDRRYPTPDQLAEAIGLLQQELAVLSGGQLWLAKEMVLYAASKWLVLERRDDRIWATWPMTGYQQAVVNKFLDALTVSI